AAVLRVASAAHLASVAGQAVAVGPARVAERDEARAPFTPGRRVRQRALVAATAAVRRVDGDVDAFAAAGGERRVARERARAAAAHLPRWTHRAARAAIAPVRLQVLARSGAHGERRGAGRDAASGPG